MSAMGAFATNVSLGSSPFIPKHQTSCCSAANVEMGEFQTHAPQQNALGLPSKIAKSLAEIAPLKTSKGAEVPFTDTSLH